MYMFKYKTVYVKYTKMSFTLNCHIFNHTPLTTPMPNLVSSRPTNVRTAAESYRYQKGWPSLNHLTFQPLLELFLLLSELPKNFSNIM